MHINCPRPRCLLLVAALALLGPTFLFSSRPTASAQTEARGLNLPNQAPARYYALVIGNNAYSVLPKLKTAESDARAVEKLLKEAYGFQTKLLVNATRAQIVSALSTYRRELTGEANLLIYYAGHGYNDKETEKTYWLPVDAERDDQSNWIIADEITSGIRAIPARHVLVVSDSCYSGTLTRGIGEMLPRPTEREQFLQRMAAGRSRTLMASGGDEPVADSGGGGHSVFAGALLRGLREMDKGQFTAAELFRGYVEEAVAGRAQQTPEYNPLRNSGHESGDFIFIKLGAGDKVATVKAAPPTTVEPAAFELEYWNAIKDSSDPEEYRGYLAKYPAGQFADIARRRAAGGRGGNGTATRTLAPAPANSAANTAPERVPPATLTNVRDYFLWLPEQYLAVPMAQRAAVLTGGGTIVDVKNGYLALSAGPAARTAIALFALSPGTHLVAVSSVNSEPNRPAARTTSQLVFLRYAQGQWHDVTATTLPAPVDPALKYELPRFGTTIVVTNQAGDKVFELLWTKGKFTLKPTR